MPPRRWDAAIFTAMLGSPCAAWHHLITSPSVHSPSLMVWAWPRAWAQNPPAVAPRATFPGVLSKLHRFPGMRLSAACRALGHKDSNSPPAARPPTSPRLLRLSQSLVTPHQHYGVARQPEPGPGAVPQPCRWNTEPDVWDGTSQPAGHVCASGEATFGLAHCIPASTDACLPSLGWGHVCGAAGLPDPCPTLADRQSWTHPGPLPAFLGDQGTVVRVQSWKVLHPSLCLTSHFHTDFI